MRTSLIISSSIDKIAFLFSNFIHLAAAKNQYNNVGNKRSIDKKGSSYRYRMCSSASILTLYFHASGKIYYNILIYTLYSAVDTLL